MSYSIEIKNVDGSSDVINHYFVNSNDVSFTINIQAVEEKPLINIWDVKYDVVPVGCGADPHHLSVEIIIKNNSGLSLVICFHDISKSENDKMIKLFNNGWAGMIKKGAFQWVIFDGRHYEFSYQPETSGISFICKIPKNDLQPLVSKINEFFECGVYPL